MDIKSYIFIYPIFRYAHLSYNRSVRHKSPYTVIFPAPLTTIGSGTKGTHAEDRLPRPTPAPEPPGGQLSSESPEGSSIDDRPAAPPPTAPTDVEPLWDES